MEAAALNAKLTGLLADRPKLKSEVQACWDEVREGKDLDIPGLKRLGRRVELEIGLPMSAYGRMKDTHERFDFNGNGTIDFKEAYKCVKRSMVDFLKTNGGHVRPVMPWKTPEEAGFTTVKKIGQGGQAQVLLAKNAKGEEVVLKIYARAHENAGGLEELMDEAESMTLLDDMPYIAKCHEIFEDTDNFYMVSALNEGGDWTTVQARAAAAGVVQSEAWYRVLFEQAFRGLGHLHRNAVMHCDIKEANLMLQDANFAKPSVVIIDLGLSKAYFPHGRELCGTPGYIPPETWQTEKWFPRGDIFSMGVVCLQLLAGSIPEGGKGGIFTTGCSSISDVHQATKRRQPPLEKVRPQSQGLIDWLAQCLEKDFHDRPRAPQVLEMPWFSNPLSPPTMQQQQSNPRRPKTESGFFGWLPCCAKRDD